MSKRNVLRYGTLADAAEALQDREPTVDELWAVILNLLAVVAALQGRIERGERV